MNQPQASADPISEASAPAAPDSAPDQAGASAPGEPVKQERAERPGKPFPLGPTWDGAGVNFALYSAGSERVDLCLFDHAGQAQESRRIRLRERTNGVWHGYLPGLGPGQLYGYRVHGPYRPAAGLRFNANKLLLDPYAKAIGRQLRWADELFGYQIGHPDEDLSFDSRDSAAYAPLAAVVDGTFDWSDDRRPDIGWSETIIYEAHVRGLTQRHPDVPPAHRGTYAGMTAEPILEHLRKLGVTTIELMPVHHFVQDRHLLDRGLRNYWGYNTLAFFAPEPGYGASRGPEELIREFKEMVQRFHAAGFEVVLDVVYNHTAEGNHSGPDALVPGHRQPGLLPGRSRRRAALHGLHRLRQHPEHDEPPIAAAAHGQPALLGDARCMWMVSASTSRPRWPAS